MDLRRGHPLLAVILTAANDFLQFAGERVSPFGIVLITPNDKLEHLGTNFAPSFERCSEPPARRPIFGLGGGDIFVRGTRVPVTVKNVKRHASIIESVGAHRQSYAVEFEHANAVVALHCPATGGKGKCGARNFGKASRGAGARPAGKRTPP